MREKDAANWVVGSAMTVVVFVSLACAAPVEVEPRRCGDVLAEAQNAATQRADIETARDLLKEAEALCIGEDGASPSELIEAREVVDSAAARAQKVADARSEMDEQRETKSPAPQTEQEPPKPSDDDFATYRAVWDEEGDAPQGDAFETVAKSQGVDRQVVFDASARVGAYHMWLRERAVLALEDGLEFGRADVATVQPSDLGEMTLVLKLTVVSCGDSYPETAQITVKELATKLWPVAVDSFQAALWMDGCKQGSLGRATWKRADNKASVVLD